MGFSLITYVIMILVILKIVLQLGCSSIIACMMLITTLSNGVLSNFLVLIHELTLSWAQ